MTPNFDAKATIPNVPKLHNYQNNYIVLWQHLLKDSHTYTV